MRPVLCAARVVCLNLKRTIIRLDIIERLRSAFVTLLHQLISSLLIRMFVACAFCLSVNQLIIVAFANVQHFIVVMRFIIFSPKSDLFAVNLAAHPFWWVYGGPYQRVCVCMCVSNDFQSISRCDQCIPNEQHTTYHRKSIDARDETTNQVWAPDWFVELIFWFKANLKS